jgi:cysteine sulfinate desulfinase/cysteine desulfurase-like protein
VSEIQYSASIRTEDNGFTVAITRLSSSDLICEYSVECAAVALDHLSYVLNRMGIEPKAVRMDLQLSCEGTG